MESTTTEPRRKVPSMPNLNIDQDLNTNYRREYSSLPNPQHFNFNQIVGLGDQPPPFQYIDSIPFESPSSFLSSIPSSTSQKSQSLDQFNSYFTSRDPILSLLQTDPKSDSLDSHTKSSSIGASESSSSTSSYGNEYDPELDILYNGLFSNSNDVGKSE